MARQSVKVFVRKRTSDRRATPCLLPKPPQQKKTPVIQINQEVLHNNLSGYDRKNLENVLNELPDAEADRLCHAKRYERNAERASTRAGSYKRNFETTSGKVTLNIPRLRNLPFETAIIERYRRRESSLEEAMMEMYLAGVSVRRVEDITKALWGARVSAGTISNLNKKIYGSIEEWRNRPLEAEYPYIYMDGIWLKPSWGGTVENVSILVAVGVNKEGYREMPGAAEGSREDAESWKHFCRYLKERGLRSAKLIISDKSLGI